MTSLYTTNTGKIITSNMTLPDTDYHVTSLSQCSNRSIPSDNESLPALTPRNMQKVRSGVPSLRYTTNREKPSKHSSILKLNSDTDTCILSDSTPIHRIEQPDFRPVFLPHIADSDQKIYNFDKLSGDTDTYIRFPEINVVSKVNARLALNRSITDLLDPELEILNRIKHVPRKKRRKRRQKLIYPIEKLTVSSEQKIDSD